MDVNEWEVRNCWDADFLLIAIQDTSARVRSLFVVSTSFHRPAISAALRLS